MKYLLKLGIVLPYTLLLAFPLFGKEIILNTEDIIKLIEKNNAAVKISASGTDLARSIYNQVLTSGNPTISFTSDSFASPLYGYSNSSFSSASPITSETHSVSAGLTISQLLPTGGTASLTVDNSLSVSRGTRNDPWEISQEPGFSLNLRQPVFSNGKLIDFSVMGNTRENSQISFEISRMNNLGTKNKVLIAVLSLVHRTNILRQSKLIMKKRIKLANFRVEMARQDREGGRISSSDFLGIELDVGRQKEALFDMEYQLAQAEMEISRVLGIEDPSAYKFNLNLTTVDVPGSLESDSVAHSNPDVLKATLNVKQKKITHTLNKFADAPVLNFVIQAGPRYPGSRTDTSDFISSLTDLFSNEAGINLSLGASLNFDIWDGGVSKSARETDRVSLEIAQQNLEDSVRKARQTGKNFWEN